MAYGSLADRLVVVDGLENCKVRIRGLVTQQVRATLIARVKVGKDVVELGNSLVLVVIRGGRQTGDPGCLFRTRI